MPTNHPVEQGEHLSGIAKKYGFADYQTIWDHPNNAELKKKRQNPNVLLPGDRVFIPDHELREESRSTDQRHRFEARKRTLKLRLVLEDIYEKPIATAKCQLLVDSNLFELTTDGHGKLEHEISPEVKNARLIIKDEQTPFNDAEIPIKIGHLDPVEELSGQKARLNNLGYFAGAIDGEDEEQLRSAVEEFQCDHGLKVDGICGPKTQAKLKQVHGC